MAFNPPLKGVAYEFYVSLVSQSNTKVFQSNPTLAAGDAKVSKDGGAPANLATLPAAVSSGKLVKINLSATEMNANNVTVILADASGAEWCDLTINIQTVDATIPAHVASMADNVITAAKINNNAITSGKIATGAISADGLAADAVAEIADGVWDEALGGHATAGSAGKALSDAGGAGASPAAIADAVWDEALAGHVAAGSAGKALDEAAKGNQVGGSAAAATTMSQVYQKVIVRGAAAAGTLSSTVATTNLTGFANDAFNGRTITWETGNRKGEMATITDYAASGGRLTFSALTGAPASGDEFTIA